MDSGGWTVLNSWLSKAKDSNDVLFLLELLKVYQALPVTVELLKETSCAKSIKQLSKSDDQGLCSKDAQFQRLNSS